VSHPQLIEGEIRVLGARWNPRVHAVKAFLARSRVVYRWSEVDQPLTVIFPDGTRLVDPDVGDVATHLGLETEPDNRHYDLVVVGGGPAGLTAAINAASEGLRTIVVEQEVPGGQASYSAIVENYPGFPEGLSGSDLARRTVEQAERFGAEILVTRRATALRSDGTHHVMALDTGADLTAETVVLSVGVTFRWLDAPGCSQLIGAGIYYGAAIAEASACSNQDIYILGGGNSAGQAALLLSQYARRVFIVALERSLEETMAKYLVDRIRRLPNVVAFTCHTVARAEGEKFLERLTLQNLDTGETRQVEASGLFVFIGATPRTEWLADTLARDDQGFLLTGSSLPRDGNRELAWPLDRRPYPLETNRPGVFAAGDVRCGSVKRIAAAVGEGAMAVQLVHRYRREHAERAAVPGGGSS
jgi:thioredoxin reductase (NADPH)